MGKQVIDEQSAILSVDAGAGGAEACDWAAMLLRMYRRFAEANGYDFAVVSSVGGNEAGIRKATATIQGPRAYALLKGEVGVHRLVRVSPFDAAKRRHTSFSAVDVIPDTEEGNATPGIPVIDYDVPIRSYVLHPYTMVKDHRTDVEATAAQAVLDGALDKFL